MPCLLKHSIFLVTYTGRLLSNLFCQSYAQIQKYWKNYHIYFIIFYRYLCKFDWNEDLIKLWNKKEVVKLASVGNSQCLLWDSQKSPHFQQLEQDIPPMINLPHLRLLQHLTNFNFCDGCKDCTANLNCSFRKSCSNS